MKENYKINDNKIIINDIEHVMDYPIKTTKSINGKIIILLNIPRGITIANEEKCNILCYDNVGNFQWRVNESLPKGIESTDLIPYIDIDIDIQDKKLYGFDFWGRKFHIDISTGELLDFKVFR